MKTTSAKIVAVCLAATLAAAIAQSKFSGIYPGNSSPDAGKFLLAITKGGHVFGINDLSSGLKKAIDPAKSTVNADGKFKGVNGSGTSYTGTISPDYQFKGTAKGSAGTYRLSAHRTLD